MTTITALPTPPSRSDPTNFAARGDEFLGALPLFQEEANLVAGEVNANAATASSAASTATTKAAEASASAASAVNAPGTNATSTTSNTIGTGSKTFTIQTGKAYVVGMFLIVAYTTDPSQYVYGQITAYNSGTGSLTLLVSAVGGSGTYAAWTVSLSGPGAGGGATGTAAITGGTANNMTLGQTTPAAATVTSLRMTTATWATPGTLTTTTGAVTVNWSANNNYVQNEPTGSITYTFTAPAGPCHLQLEIASDGTSTAQTFTFPGTVIFLNSTWAAVNNKKAILNFWYNGSVYYAIGSNQV